MDAFDYFENLPRDLQLRNTMRDMVLWQDTLDRYRHPIGSAPWQRDKRDVI
jgi:hypothetical protein